MYDDPVDTGDRYDCCEPDCQNSIYFGSKDREYYVSRGWVDGKGEPIKPKRCRTCRARRNKERAKQKTA